MGSSVPSIGQTWRAIRDRLDTAGIPMAALDARLLVRHVLGLDATGLILSESDPVPGGKVSDLESLVARRLAGEPVARILSVQEFYGLDFRLNPATLIPRPETEMLVDFSIEHLKSHPAPSVADLGTGTGCILLAVLANLPKASGVSVDISADVLHQAQANAEALGLADRFGARHGSWFEPLGEEKFDLIVSNPPYIASATIETLEPGVKSFDPMAALDRGPDGLAPYRIISAQACAHLVRGGVLALEIGFDQGHMVNELLSSEGFCDIAIAKDLAGHDRMVTARVPK